MGGTAITFLISLYTSTVRQIPAVLNIKIDSAPLVMSGGTPITITQKNVRALIARVKESTNDGISGPEQRILDAIAWSESIGFPEPKQIAVAFMADYKFGGGGFNNPKGALRSKGLIEYRGDCLTLTDEGRQLANVPEIALTTEALHEKVLARLDNPQQRILRPLLEAYPEAIPGETLAEVSGYKFGTGGSTIRKAACGRSA